jgi:hypothetical protein
MSAMKMNEKNESYLLYCLEQNAGIGLGCGVNCFFSVKIVHNLMRLMLIHPHWV